MAISCENGQAELAARSTRQDGTRSITITSVLALDFENSQGRRMRMSVAERFTEVLGLSHYTADSRASRP
jgi:hypothetical protein